LILVLVFNLDMKVLDRVDADQPAPLHGAEKPPQNCLKDP
jgi:hypothetical protein